MTKNSKECAVYFLVEPRHFKIGLSISVCDRAKKVTPEIIQDESWAIYYKSSRDAQNCEHVLHRIFRSYRIPALNRDGGTEFFDRSCLEKVKNFVLQNKESLEYINIKQGSELFSSLPVPIIDPIKEERRLARIEKDRRREESILLENQHNREKFLELFKLLNKKGCFIGIDTTENQANNDCPHIYLLSHDTDEDELISALGFASFYQSKMWLGRLLGCYFAYGASESLASSLFENGHCRPIRMVYRMSTSIPRI